MYKKHKSSKKNVVTKKTKNIFTGGVKETK